MRIYSIQAWDLLNKLSLETVYNSGFDRREFLFKDSKSEAQLWH